MATGLVDAFREALSGSGRGPAAADQVLLELLTAVMASCQVFTTTQQAAVCSVLADHCPDMQVRCGNSATQTFVCRQQVAVKALGDALRASGVDLGPVLGPGQTIESAITSKCAGAGTAFQTTLLSVKCQDSRRAVYNALNTLDQDTLCAVLSAWDMYTQAVNIQSGNGGPRPGSDPGPNYNLATGVVIGVSALLVVVLIVVMAVIKPRPVAPSAPFV